jgi:serine/threonine protein kinase
MAASDPLLGRAIGRYRVEAKIGSGGMGSVYRAVHTELAELVVAVKFLSQGLSADPDLRARFRDEAAICARLGERTAHIVQIRDYGILEDLDLPFFMMEYLQGRSLQVLVGGAIDPATVAAIAVQLCEGLAAAHALPVVHRDLKPANVFLVPDAGRGERVKILDFGIARLADAAARAASGRALTQGYLGTPRYSSPEQLSGAEVTPRSDIYSLGLILYELLTGASPYEPTDASFAGWFQAHLRGEVRPMAQVNPNRTIPTELEQLVRACLARNPADRPDALAIARALAPWGDAPIRLQAIPATPPGRLTLSPEETTRLERRLASLIGPIAPALLARALSQVHSADELVTRLAEELPASLRDRFIADTPAPTAVPSSSVAPIAIPEDFLRRCERALAECVGPIAPLLVQTVLKTRPATPAALVEAISAQIGDPARAEAFRRKLPSDL